MWGSVLALALLTGLNPVRLGLTLLVISRPRPLQNLLVYWVGCLVGCIPAVVLPLVMLHITPMLKPFADALPTSSVVRHIRLGIGVLALSIAALLTVRSLIRQRQRTHLSTLGGKTSTLVLDSNRPMPLSRLLGRAQDAPMEGGSAIQRLLRRARNAWENGSLWVAFLIGVGFGGTEPDAGLFLLATIAASGAAIGTQVSAAIVFVVVVLAVVEIALISYLVAPAKTQAMVQILHEWAWIHRGKILVAICTVGGVALVANGIGSI
ncbi:GAP family protein [Mycobacterium heckeshornense]|uniref:GAP family protein n=1 Tax=Mycobacterium heckeshornense TaxID=110505 RepID=UPI00194432E8|nr:GAP family protein [Mycobacterium heckeshornense]